MSKKNGSFPFRNATIKIMPFCVPQGYKSSEEGKHVVHSATVKKENDIKDASSTDRKTQTKRF
jgi:hypothetical protein